MTTRKPRRNHRTPAQSTAGSGRATNRPQPKPKTTRRVTLRRKRREIL
jgi:hypothetical protein